MNPTVQRLSVYTILTASLTVEHKSKDNIVRDATRLAIIHPPTHDFVQSANL